MPGILLKTACRELAEIKNGSMPDNRLSIAVLLLLTALAARAETISTDETESVSQLYWVLGSFSNRQSALAESDRLDSELGMEVLVAPSSASGSVVYRLVIAAVEDGEDRQRQRTQLSNIVSHELWGVRLNPGEVTIQDMEQSDLVYIVLGSFEDVGEARQFSATIAEKTGFSAAVRPVEANGEMLQRVLLGPYYDVDETEFTRRLVMDAGVDDPWILTESSDYLFPSPDAGVFDELVTRAAERLTETATSAVQRPDTVLKPPDTDAKPPDPQQQKRPAYNFATLKPRSEASPPKAPAEDVKKKGTQ